MAIQALRGYGPRIFISYSFADAPIAQQIESVLTAKCFQVRREDDTSLLNEKLTEAIPRRLVDTDLEVLLKQLPQDGRRIIVDSDGKLLRWEQETIAFAEGIDSEHRDSFLAQERSRLDRLVRRQKIHDEVTRKLVLELMQAMKSYTNEPIKDAKKPLNHFLQIVLSDLVVTAADVAPPEPHPLRTV